MDRYTGENFPNNIKRHISNINFYNKRRDTHNSQILILNLVLDLEM